MRKLKITRNHLIMLLWFSRHPRYWEHAVSMIVRKFLVDHDSVAKRRKAHDWAASHSVPYSVALKKMGIEGEIIGLEEALINQAKKRAARASVKMGGSGDGNLLFDAVRLIKATKVIETGVAYGWSSLAILHAMSINGGGRLFSVDMPYPNKSNEEFVGVVVPDTYRQGWTLIREPDRRGLVKAIDVSGGQVDLCHYDSDKNWWGRAYGFPLLWDALRSGGIFISDDIQDNLFFSKFVADKSIPFSVTQFEGKFIGILRKP